MFVNASSSVQRLPNELLATIFQLAVRDTGDVNDSISIPLAISATCTRWRALSLSTGRLWSTVLLSCPSDSENLLLQLSRASAWLERSKSFPLDIILEFRDPDWDWVETAHLFHWEDMESVLRVILPSISRWRTLDLLTDTWEPMFTFLIYARSVSIADDTPLILESISLSRCNAYLCLSPQTFKPAKFKEPVVLFGGCLLPRLKSIKLAGVHVDWSSPCLKNLTTFELRYHARDVMPTVPQLVNILNACPNLRDLALVGCGPQPSIIASVEASSFPTSPIPRERDVAAPQELMHLSKLSFGFVDIEDAVNLLPLFYLPSVCDLSIHDIKVGLLVDHCTDTTPLLQFFIENRRTPSNEGSAFSLSSVTSLSLSGISANTAVFSDFLSQFTALETLSLVDTDASAVSALGIASPILPCPHLSELSVKDRGVDLSILVEVVNLRAADSTVSGLDNVRADMAIYLPEDSPQKKALMDAGIILIERPDYRLSIQSLGQSRYNSLVGNHDEDGHDLNEYSDEEYEDLNDSGFVDSLAVEEKLQNVA